MLIKCNECKNLVSDKALSCPSCGNVLRKPLKNVGCFMRTLNMGCMTILVIVAIYFVVGFCYIVYKYFSLNNCSPFFFKAPITNAFLLSA